MLNGEQLEDTDQLFDLVSELTRDPAPHEREQAPLNSKPHTIYNYHISVPVC